MSPANGGYTTVYKFVPPVLHVLMGPQAGPRRRALLTATVPSSPNAAGRCITTTQITRY